MKMTLSCTEEGRARASAHSKHMVSVWPPAAQTQPTPGDHTDHTQSLDTVVIQIGVSYVPTMPESV